MKKICLFLSLLVLLLPFTHACENKADESGTEMLNLTSGFDEFYKARHLVCWQDVAAVYSAKLKISDYEYTYSLEKTETLTDRAGYVISVSLIARQGNDVSAYDTDNYIDEIKTALDNGYAALTVKEMALCFFALTAAETDFDYEKAAKHLETLQEENGGFPVSADYANPDAESSAYALNVIMLSRRYISDNCYNGVLRYLGNKINDDNTLSDIDNKKSAFTTALTLNSLISASIPLDGEISTSLTTAINSGFKVEENPSLTGYKRYKDDTAIDRTVTGEVMLCFAATSYGNLWINFITQDNSDI
ncbi:MAG: hypothetical protein PHD66_06715 [Eubacteriales bacterium]|nr:hypothetical protein [Eubacteriales bacterium]